MSKLFEQVVFLTVDDEPDNLNVIVNLLQFYGGTVYQAEDGNEGLAMALQHTPHIIITDLSMPEMDGWEFHKKIREMSSFDSIPVIALTAHAMVGDQEKVMKAGFSGYISKPIKIREFLGEFLEILNDFPMITALLNES